MAEEKIEEQKVDAPVPDPTKPPVPEPTEEELRAAIDEFKSTFYSGEDLRTRQGKSRKEAARKAADEAVIPASPDPIVPPVEPEPVVAIEPPAEPLPVVPDPYKKVVVPPRPDFTVDDTEEKLAARVAERLKQTAQPPVEVPLAVREQKLVEVLKVMEEIDPSYKNLDKRYLAHRKAEAAYITRWETENPGSNFDEEDTEHDDFYKKSKVDYDPTDFAMAVDELAKKKSTEINEALIDKKLKERDQKLFANEARQRITSVVNDSITEFIEKAVPEFSKIINVDGRVTINQDTEKKMAEKDPVALSILHEESEQMAIVVRELEEMCRLGDAYTPDQNRTVRLANKGVRFSPFREMLDSVNNLETEMLKLPPEQTVRNGKRLLSIQEFTTYQEQAANSPAMQQRLSRDYYCLNGEDYRTGIVAQSVATAKSRIAKLRSSNGKPTTPTPQPEPKATTQEPPIAGVPTARRSGSTVVASSDTVNTRSEPVSSEEDVLKIILASRVSK